jgi:hypothetical protein
MSTWTKRPRRCRYRSKAYSALAYLQLSVKPALKITNPKKKHQHKCPLGLNVTAVAGIEARHIVRWR